MSDRRSVGGDHSKMLLWHVTKGHKDYIYWVDVVTSADDKILCQIVECLWGRPIWAAPMTLTYWCIFGTSHRHTMLTCHIFVGLPTIPPKDESRGNCILFLGLGWQTNFRKSLQSWRLGGDLWVLKLVTRLICKKCVWVVFCFSLGLKYRQST